MRGKFMVRKVRERVWKVSGDLYHTQVFEDVLNQRKSAGWLVLENKIGIERNVASNIDYYTLQVIEIFCGKRRVLSDGAKKLVEYYNSQIGKRHRFTIAK
jgi:hypothetical protein